LQRISPGFASALRSRDEGFNGFQDLTFIHWHGFVEADRISALAGGRQGCLPQDLAWTLPSTVIKLKANCPAMRMRRIDQLFQTGDHGVRVNAALPFLGSTQGMYIKMAGNDQADVPFSQTGIAPDYIVGNAAVISGHRFMRRRVDESIFYWDLGEHNRLKQA
jgi:hypothetical protein